MQPQAGISTRWATAGGERRADGVEVGVGLGPRALLGDLGAEFDERTAARNASSSGRPGFVERLEVEGDEAVALLVCDRESAVHVDDVLEADLSVKRPGRRATPP